MALSDNIWWTRKARIQTEKRLLSDAIHAQLLLLWYSFFSVAVAVYYLGIKNESVEQDFIEITWVVFSVLILCISGFIKGFSFKERAALVKECYETLNTLYQKSNNQNSSSEEAQLMKEYNQILGVCENHTDRDYYLALCIEHISTKGNKDKITGLKAKLDRCPTWFHWTHLAFWYFRRILKLSFLYILPILIFASLGYFA